MSEKIPFFSEDQETFYGEIDGVRWTHEGELGDALSLSITTSAKLISEQLHFALCNIEEEFIFVGNIKPAFEAFNMNELRYLHIDPAQKTIFGDGEKLEIKKTLAQLSPKLTVKYKKIEGAMFQRSALELNVLILDPTREQLLNYGRIGTSVILTISPRPIELVADPRSEVKGRISRIAGENKEAAESNVNDEHAYQYLKRATEYDSDGSVTISSDFGSVTLTDKEFSDPKVASEKVKGVVAPVIENALGKGRKHVLKPKNGGTEARA